MSDIKKAEERIAELKAHAAAESAALKAAQRDLKAAQAAAAAAEAEAARIPELEDALALAERENAALAKQVDQLHRDLLKAADKAGRFDQIKSALI